MGQYGPSKDDGDAERKNTAPGSGTPQSRGNSEEIQIKSDDFHMV